MGHSLCMRIFRSPIVTRALLSDLGVESQCQPMAQWKPSLIAREACFEKLKSRLRATRKKQRLALPGKPLHTTEILVAPSTISAAITNIDYDVSPLATAQDPVFKRISARQKGIRGQHGQPSASLTPDSKKRCRAQAKGPSAAPAALAFGRLQPLGATLGPAIAQCASTSLPTSSRGKDRTSTSLRSLFLCTLHSVRKGG